MAHPSEARPRAELARRLFKLDHNSRLDQLEAAYRAIGVDVTLTVSEAAEAV